MKEIAVQKWWSVLFGGVMVAATILVIVTPLVGWGLPKNVSSYGGAVDNLFHFILFITGIFFILTEALLVYFLFKYAGGAGKKEHVVGHHYAEEKVYWTSFFKRIARPVTVLIHDQHRLELAWSIVPGVILIIIAVTQIHTWLEIKDRNWMPKPGELPQQIEVSARQFEWRMRYPSAERMKSWEENPALADDFRPRRFFDKEMGQWISNYGQQEDDVHTVSEVHVWKDNRVLIHLATRDVIHSFYLPNLRLKQDALPGKIIPVWFESLEANTKLNDETGKWEDGFDPQEGTWGHSDRVWELACAELCGWGHYKMQGKLYVHETKEDFLKWLEYATKEQRRTQPEESKAKEEAQ
jgi:cytochrome c oxidase subunit 2